MSVFGDRVKALRLSMNLSLRELSKLTDISPSAIHSYEVGTRNAGYEALEALSDVFNCDIDYLLGKSDVKNKVANDLGFDSLEEAYKAKLALQGFFDPQTIPNARPIVRKRLPMLGNVACGEPIFAQESHESYVDANSDTDADFCLTAKGDSMINARIFDGDVLFVKSQPTVENGEIAVVLIEDEATVKRVYYDKENNVITLAPENPVYKPMRYEGTALDRIRILGKVVSGQYKI